MAVLKEVHTVPLTQLQDFLERVFAFSTAWEEAGKANDGSVSDLESLKLGTSLHADLNKISNSIPAQVPADKDAEETYGRIHNDIKAACERLREQLDVLGLKWLKAMASASSASESAKPLSEIAAEAIVSPTPRLKDALASCKLVNEVSKIESRSKDLAEASLAGLADVLSQYVMVSSMDADLMEAISPSSIEACKNFQQEFDLRFKDLCASFQQNADQFKMLADKYEQLGFIT